jgi:hypothetical protein
MAKNNIKAYSPNVLDYLSNLSMCEKKALRQRPNLLANASQRKSSPQKISFQS